ncbi:MAG: HAMP domain-containing histidine kinase [Lachnospiraceae bacterium]|nr:HAMP domain-containing histidine kinase [Lachnospiraceae bacterium]
MNTKNNDEHENQEIAEPIKNIPQQKKPKRNKKFPLWLFHSLQRAFLVAGAIFITCVLINSTISIDTGNGFYQNYSLFNNIYNIYEDVYEDSALFTTSLSYRISDIITLGAIQSQLETDGKLDSRKAIDVTAYSNRFHGVPLQYITAFYYLGDLINWSQNGFVYRQQVKTASEIEEFFAPENIYFNSQSSDYDEELIILFELSEQQTEKTIEMDLSVDLILDIEYQNELAENKENQPQAYEILDNLYQSIEGKNAEDYVADYVSYRALCQNIERSALDLSYNYGQYERIKNLVTNSNLKYIIKTTLDGTPTIYTNYESASRLDSEDIFGAIEDDKYGKYIKYNPSGINFETNTNLSEAFIRTELQAFSYAYPADTMIWIGIDTSYPEDDIFSQGHLGYQKFYPDYLYYLVLAGICMIMFFILLIFLTKHTGRYLTDDGTSFIKLKGIDYIYTEIWLFLSLIVPLFMLYVTVAFIDSTPFYNWNYQSYRYMDVWIYIIVGGYIYLFSLVFSLFYYSLIRRLKAKRLYEDSIIKRIIHYFKKAFKTILKLMIFAYDNANLLSRFILPTLGIVFYHFFMVLIIANFRDGFVQFTFGLLIIVSDIIIGGLIFIQAKAREKIVFGINKISSGDINHKVSEEHLHGDNLVLAKAVNSIGTSISTAVDISMRDERMKADLITNVSHDIKTPLTSIINYIDLIKREDITDETIKNYVEILETKSQRLKQLTDDLVEASKISSGNIEFKMEKINLTELVNQTIGEFKDKFAQRNLQINLKSCQENLQIEADSRRIWRVIENLFNNIEKYAMQNTRVYIEITQVDKEQVELSIKNISEQPLNFNAEELTERFIRGDVSRSTEGSGLGLSIAKSLTEAQNGSFKIKMDGDLFKVMLKFPLLGSD